MNQHSRSLISQPHLALLLANMVRNCRDEVLCAIHNAIICQRQAASAALQYVSEERRILRQVRKQEQNWSSLINHRHAQKLPSQKRCRTWPYGHGQCQAETETETETVTVLQPRLDNAPQRVVECKLIPPRPPVLPDLCRPVPAPSSTFSSRLVRSECLNQLQPQLCASTIKYTCLPQKSYSASAEDDGRSQDSGQHRTQDAARTDVGAAVTVS